MGYEPIVAAGAALVAYHKSYGPAARVEEITKTINEAKKINEETLKMLSPKHEDELQKVQDQRDSLFA